MASLASRRTRMIAVDTERASPFAQSLLFAWIAVFMYEGDAPLAERRAAALSLDRDLLRDLLGSEDLRELLDPAALDAVELELQRLVGRAAGSLPRRGPRPAARPRSAQRRRDRGTGRPSGERRGPHAGCRAPGVPGRDRRGGAGRRRGGCGAAARGVGRNAPRRPPERVRRGPGASHRGPGRSVRPHARSVRHGRHRSTGSDSTPSRSAEALEALAAADRVVHGEFRPGGFEREWCDANVLASDPPSLAGGAAPGGGAGRCRGLRPVPARVAGCRSAAAGTRRADPGAAAAAGIRHPASILERDVLPARVQGFRPADLDALTASGELVWIGAPGRSGPTTGASRCCSATGRRRSCRSRSRGRPDRCTMPSAATWPTEEPRSGPTSCRQRARPIRRCCCDRSWDLVWAGEVTNDTLAPLRAFARSGRRRAAHARQTQTRRSFVARDRPPAPDGGRWWPIFVPRRSAPPSAPSPAPRRLLDRYGVVTREAVLAENTPGGFAGVYPVLRAMEESGSARRGYFVAGLGAAQFAVPGAVDRLRAARESRVGGADARRGRSGTAVRRRAALARDRRSAVALRGLVRRAGRAARRRRSSNAAPRRW